MSDCSLITNLIKKLIVPFTLGLGLCFICPSSVYAVDTIPTEDQLLQAEQRKSLPVETNDIVGWPDGPIIGAQSAVVMDVATGTLMYSKNPHDELFPASTTKLLTGLLVIENTSMDEMVTFSSDAVWNIDRGSTHLSIDVGEQLSVEDCLYGLLLASANEVAYALAEHVGGDMDTFVQMMNDRAQALGCKNTHFSNSNGLPRDDHYTSAYDLALIARECFKNETFCTICGTTKYTIKPTNKQPEERPITNHQKLLPGFKYEYEGFLGGKTGYTEVARQTLVSCAERGGMRLICVVMKEEAPKQFTDTIELFDYAFSSFQCSSIADLETRYDLNSEAFFKTKYDILGSTKPILSINKAGKLIMPKSMTIDELDTEVIYSDNALNNKDQGSVATLQYSLGGNPVGHTTIDYASDNVKAFEFSTITELNNSDTTEAYTPDHKVIFINVKKVAITCGYIIGIIFVVFFLIDQIKRYIVSKRRDDRLKRNRFKKRSENKQSSRAIMGMKRLLRPKTEVYNGIPQDAPGTRGTSKKLGRRQNLRVEQPGDNHQIYIHDTRNNPKV